MKEKQKIICLNTYKSKDFEAECERLLNDGYRIISSSCNALAVDDEHWVEWCAVFLRSDAILHGQGDDE
jgi:hypothetical protein